MSNCKNFSEFYKITNLDLIRETANIVLKDCQSFMFVIINLSFGKSGFKEGAMSCLINRRTITVWVN